MTKKIGLDAGHGYNTPGKRTPDGIREWTLNDKVCDKVQAILKDYDCTIIRTDHNEGKTDEGLSSRRNEYLRADVDAFVSVHHNALNSKWGNHTGVEVWVDRNATSKDNALAKAIHKRLSKYTGLKDRGIKVMNWAVINQNKIPAVLVEGGFMDSKIDHPVLTSDKGQQAYAKAVAEGLIEFLGLKKKKTSSPSSTKASASKKPTKSGEYKVEVTISDLNIRKGPGTDYAKTGKTTGKGTFTITQTKTGKGSTKGWGKLKSGLGWISLDYAKRK